LGIAYLSYRYYESPFLALKTKYSRLRPVPAPPAGTGVAGPEVPAATHP
jgi:hypothetical protein